MHDQLLTELEPHAQRRGLALSASKEVEPGARVMLLLAEGLFRIDVVVYGDSLRTVVRCFCDGPLEMCRAQGGSTEVFGEAAELQPGRADLEFTLGVGAERLRVKVAIATLRWRERGTVRISANAIARQDPGSVPA